MATLPPLPNRYMLVSLTAASAPPVELPVGMRVSLGRRSNPSLNNNLHISREQVVFELKPDDEGRILICMTNRGKNSTRVLSIARRKQARVMSNTYCRLLPGDVVELLYDQQGKFAFKLIEASRDGGPILSHSTLVPSVSLYRPPAPPSLEQILVLLTAARAQWENSRALPGTAPAAAAKQWEVMYRGACHSILRPRLSELSEACAKRVEAALLAAPDTTPAGLDAAIRGVLEPEAEFVGAVSAATSAPVVARTSALLPGTLPTIGQAHTIAQNTNQMAMAVGGEEATRAITTANDANLLAWSKSWLLSSVADAAWTATLRAHAAAAASAPIPPPTSRGRSGGGLAADAPGDAVLHTTLGGPVGSFSGTMSGGADEDVSSIGTQQWPQRGSSAGAASRLPGAQQQQQQLLPPSPYAGKSSPGAHVINLPLSCPAPAVTSMSSGGGGCGSGRGGGNDDMDIGSAAVLARVMGDAGGGGAHGRRSAGASRAGGSSSGLGGLDAYEERDADEDDGDDVGGEIGLGRDADEDEDDDDDDSMIGGRPLLLQQQQQTSMTADGSGGGTAGEPPPSPAQKQQHLQRRRSNRNSHSTTVRLGGAASAGKSAGVAAAAPRLPMPTLSSPQPPPVGSMPDAALAFGGAAQQQLQPLPSTTLLLFNPAAGDHTDAAAAAAAAAGAFVFGPPTTPPQLQLPTPSEDDASSSSIDINALSSRGSAGFAALPTHLLGPILSYLSLPELLHAGRVCVEWHTEVRRRGALSVLDVGNVFAGPLHPHPAILDAIAGGLSARDYAFGNCMWLSSGALLHLIGVRVGVAAGARMPPIPRMLPTSDGRQRESTSQAAIVSMASMAAEAAAKAAAEGSAPAPPPLLPHSYLRWFLDELNEADFTALSKQARAADAAAAAATAAASSSVSRGASGGALRSNSRLSANTSGSVEGEGSDTDAASMDCDAMDDMEGDGAISTASLRTGPRRFTASQPARRGDDDAAAAAAAAAGATGTPSALPLSQQQHPRGMDVEDAPAPFFSSSSSGGSPSAPRPWWHEIDAVWSIVMNDAKAVMDAAHSGAVSWPSPAAWLPPRDAAMLLVQAEVVRARAEAQYTRMFQTSVFEGGSPSPDAFGITVARAYAEMSLALKCLLFRYKKAAAEHQAAVAAAANTPTLPPSPPTFLLSRLNPLCSLPMQGAGTLFAPVDEVLKAARVVVAREIGAAEGDAIAAARAAGVSVRLHAYPDGPPLSSWSPSSSLHRSGGGGRGSAMWASMPTSALYGGPGGGEYRPLVTVAPGAYPEGSASAAIAAAAARGILSPETLQGVVSSAVALALSEPAAIHALSAGYATSVADLMDFHHQLSSVKRERAAVVARGGPRPVPPAYAIPVPHPNIDPMLITHAASHEISAPAASMSSFPAASAVARRRRARSAAAAAAAAASSSSSSSMMNVGDDLTPYNDDSFDTPGPSSGGAACAWEDREEEEEEGGDCFSFRNLVGAPLPLTAAAHVTGLDLHGCTRLAPQNLSTILSYCPHLVVLRLGGCSQFTAELLASVAPLMRNLRQLDLEYCSAVNDGVLRALGAHAVSLFRLQLVGCTLITDAGIVALLGVATNLRCLNLRGCRLVTDPGLLHLARHAPKLREVCLAGLTSVTADSLAHLIVSARKLTRFKGELWYDSATATTQPPAAAAAGAAGGGGAAAAAAAGLNVYAAAAPGAAAAAAAAAAASAGELGPDGQPRRSYRLLGSVRGAVRYLRSVLPPDHPCMAALNARYREHGGVVRAPQIDATSALADASSATSAIGPLNLGGAPAEASGLFGGPSPSFLGYDDDAPDVALDTEHDLFMRDGGAMREDVEDVVDDIAMSQLPDLDGDGPFGAAPWRTPERPTTAEDWQLHPNAARDRLMPPSRDAEQ